ncbi:DUF4153 domain-containing protein [Flavobacterium tructae]|uniref:DUF4153 domain-containing protein n=1 Tax=Flavobacterium tructae TaxID=1114873 RepID=A0A1S1J619_9FLAO|nr:DUF4153 domain-containing protein [Flavobacterium tructae]OHT46102.1 DUF4153 domain-containing protein [Flavobacterium tructae]OXB22061.1 DUF4153 domain-containing protein [Flavobacterium tructae]
MSKLPSLQNVLNATLKTVIRFPLEILTAILGTVFAIILSEGNYNSPNKEFYEKALMSCSLSLVLFLSVSLFFLASKKSNLLRFAISIGLGSLVFLFVNTFHKYTTDVEIQQFMVLNIVFHLLVSFAGFLPRAYNQDEFWEFNKQLFLRILTAGLYSIVLYSGLALAILAIDKLFNIDFYDRIYMHVFFVIAGIFNTTFFLSGVPDTNNSQTPLVLNYPKGLKNFTQFVLLPLISLYLVILICYEAKILLTLSLPVGWVSYLVLVFAIFGILSFLLVHPIASETGNLWMRTFNRWFYFLLIPLLVLLFWAILYRINLYGFTHERYYVLLMSVWLSLVVGYFLIQKHPKIKFIPISLCLAGLFSIAGPQSANSISKYSQLARFESYVQNKTAKKLSFEQQQDLSSIVSFLERNYGVEIMVPYAKTKLEALLKKEKDPSDYEIMEALGYEYQSAYAREEKVNDSFYFYYQQNEVLNIHGYDFSVDLSSDNPYECHDCVKIENKSYSLTSTVEDYGLNLEINKESIPLKITDFINASPDFRRDHDYDKKVTQEVQTSKYKILITYLSANGKIKDNKKTVNRYMINVLVQIKK